MSQSFFVQPCSGCFETIDGHRDFCGTCHNWVYPDYVNPVDETLQSVELLAKGEGE